MPKLYHSVPLDEEESLTGSSEKRLLTTTTTWDRSSLSGKLGGLQKHWAWLAHAVLLSISLTLFTLSFCTKTVNVTDPAVLNKIATYSPLFPAVTYNLQKFTLRPITNSPYAGYGPEVDRAWDLIANDAGDIMITEEERIKLGLSPKSLKIQHPKTGEWGYRAGVEVFHQLHCLNLLRQTIYKKEYYGNVEIGGDVGDAASIEDLNGHVDHCIEAIRENLMCQSDVGVFTFKTFPELADQGIEGEWPDFEINHMCRNFDAVKKWNNDHVVAWTHDV